MVMKQDVLNRQLPAMTGTTGRETVTTTAAVAVVADHKRQSVKLTNKGTVEIFLGFTEEEADDMEGESLLAGGSVVLGVSCVLWARTASSSAPLVVTSVGLL